MKNIILIAVQGAGKGTLANALKEKYGYVHVSIGDILRERALVGDELGREIHRLQDEGIFISNDIVLKTIKDKISSPECANGYVLDGFPRDLSQAEGYDKILEELGLDIGVVINMVVDESLLKNRIIGRRMCKECGAIYNIYNKEMMPKRDGICDKCGGVLYQRSDDNEDAMNKRIKKYHEVTEPLIDYYKAKGILYEVDAIDATITLKQVEDILNK